MDEIDRQLRIISHGCDEVIVEAELRDKIRTGRPLRVKLGMALVQAILQNRNEWDYQMFKRVAEDIDAKKEVKPRKKKIS